MDLATFLSEWGLPGALLGLAIWGLTRQWNRTNELSDARLADHKAFTDQLLALQREHVTQLLANGETLRRALDVVEAK